MKADGASDPTGAGKPEERPSSARIYDYLLGGYHNFEADRVVAQKFIEILPSAPLIMKANRAFLRRAVNFLLDRGVEQFLDLGSGIPTVGNVHEIAQKSNPDARVVYVDIDPVAVSQSKTLLEDLPNATVLQQDIRHPQIILEHPETRRLLDFDKPVAALITSVLMFLPEDREAFGLVDAVRRALPPGSYIGISHGTLEGTSREQKEGGRQLYEAAGTPVKLRSRAEIRGFFDKLEVVEPGLVYLPQWRPESASDVLYDQPESSEMFGGLGLKP